MQEVRNKDERFIYIKIMIRLKIDEAIAWNTLQGRKISVTGLAEKLFPESKKGAQQVCFSLLRTGKTKRIKLEWLETLTKELNVTLNQLLGYEDFK